jgi:hypothetical protein
MIERVRDLLGLCCFALAIVGLTAPHLTSALALDRPVMAADWRYGICFDRGYVFPGRAGSFSSPMCYAEDRELGYPLPGCSLPSGPLMLVPNSTRLE